MEDKPLMIDALDGYEFEELVAKIMKKKGYKILEILKSKDIGRDIIMETPKGERIIVECKHQKLVGRPIIQKLQGAINYEETKNPKKKIKGMIVTSGSFSQDAVDYNKKIGHEVELINGKKLQKLCQELKIVILNSKVQVITNKSFKNILEKESKELTLKNYSKIYGNKRIVPEIKTLLEYRPSCYIKYNVAFNTSTSVGCIENYNAPGQIAIDGITGEEIAKNIQDFYFSGKFNISEIKDKNKISHFKLTETDIEEHAINSIIQEHTHNVHYMGRNNVSYSKTCAPTKRNIDLKEFIPIYMPLWENKIELLKINYKQQFLAKGEHTPLCILDELKQCKICNKQKEEYQEMSVCPECGRIVCHKHVKIDYLDKETPICTIHAKPVKIFLQNKYFASKENVKKYQEWLKSRNFFQKLYEDKIAFGLSIAGICGIILLIISLV